MTRYEKEEIQALDPRYRPLGAWGYFGYTVLFGIPILGFICLLIFSFSGSNINRRSFARSYFCGLLLVLIFAVILIVTGFGAEIISKIADMIPSGQ